MTLQYPGKENRELLGKVVFIIVYVATNVYCKGMDFPG